jgi:hypothetical protein
VAPDNTVSWQGRRLQIPKRDRILCPAKFSRLGGRLISAKSLSEPRTSSGFAEKWHPSKALMVQEVKAKEIMKMSALPHPGIKTNCPYGGG